MEEFSSYNFDLSTTHFQQNKHTDQFAPVSSTIDYIFIMASPSYNELQVRSDSEEGNYHAAA